MAVESYGIGYVAYCYIKILYKYGTCDKGNMELLSQYAPLLKVMWPAIDQSALSIYMWNIIYSEMAW